MRPNELAILRRLWNVGPTHRSKFNSEQLQSVGGLVLMGFVDVGAGGLTRVNEAGLLALVHYYLSIPPANPSPAGTVIYEIEPTKRRAVA